MEISFGRVKEIAQSLPIGFYAKEKIMIKKHQHKLMFFYKFYPIIDPTVLGKISTSLMFATPVKYMTSLSKPTP